MKRIFWIVVMAITVLFRIPVHASSETLNIEEKDDCSITLLLGEGDQMLVGGTIALYKVAGVHQKPLYFDVSRGQFAGSDTVKDIPGMNSQKLEEQNSAIAQKLEKETNENAVVPLSQKKIENGQVKFEGLTPGLYFLVQSELSEGQRKMNPFLLSIPDQSGSDDPVLKPKPGIYYPPEPTPTLTPTPSQPPETTEPPATPSVPEQPSRPQLPRTGQNWLPVPFLFAVGMILIVHGLHLFRKDRTE